nr:DUF6233 domain-containing protein [Streptomyces sp. NBC_01175]
MFAGGGAWGRSPAASRSSTGITQPRTESRTAPGRFGFAAAADGGAPATARGGGLPLSERARPLRPGLLQPRLCPARGTPHSATISDLDKNRALLEWLRRQVGQTERRIRELEIQEAQERERARAEMSWKIQPQRSSSVALLHRGGCATYPDQVGLISREDAMIALAEPDIEPCQVCRPDTGLLR